jgi:nucleoside 2-deoxyribosyltransferase
MKVYLAGDINGLSNEDVFGWRSEIKSKADIGIEFLDPTSRDYRGQEDENVEEIVLGDLKDIDSVDIMIASAGAPSWGTAMEIHYAYTQDIPVVAIVPGDRVSPWLRFHVQAIVPDIDTAVEWINAAATVEKEVEELASLALL